MPPWDHSPERPTQSGALQPSSLIGSRRTSNARIDRLQQRIAPTRTGALTESDKRRTATPFSCPCCSCLTLPEQPPGTFFICPVCDWEDDDVQFRDPSYEGGANHVSLSMARSNYIRYGASTLERLPRVRRPMPDEIPEDVGPWRRVRRI